VCSCNRERVSAMIRSLGRDEADSILAERELIEVGCDFCGQQYRYDAIDAAQLFVPGQPPVPPASSALQ
jgi:molecular chaperone Hsp33